MPKTRHRNRIVSATIAPLSFPVYVGTVWIDDDKVSSRRLQAIGVQTAIVQRFSDVGRPAHEPESPGHAAMLRAGWEFCYEEAESDLLVWDDEGCRPITYRDWIESDGSNSASFVLFGEDASSADMIQNAVDFNADEIRKRMRTAT